MSKITTWLRYVAGVEPVYLSTAIGAIVITAGVWGLELTALGDQVTTTLQQAIVLAGAILTIVRVRDRVTPTAAVVARVDDPALPTHKVAYLAGGYSEVPTGARVGRLSTLDTLTQLESSR
jgi:hypothetical protein